MVVLKGLELHIPLDEIKEDLEGQGYKIKNIANITNRNKVTQPMFRVELEPSSEKYKKIEDHPIYKIWAVLYRRNCRTIIKAKSSHTMLQLSRIWAYTRLL